MTSTESSEKPTNPCRFRCCQRGKGGERETPRRAVSSCVPSRNLDTPSSDSRRIWWRYEPRSGDTRTKADGCGSRRSSRVPPLQGLSLLCIRFLGLTPQARLCRAYGAYRNAICFLWSGAHAPGYIMSPLRGLMECGLFPFEWCPLVGTAVILGGTPHRSKLSSRPREQSDRVEGSGRAGNLRLSA